MGNNRYLNGRTYCKCTNSNGFSSWFIIAKPFRINCVHIRECAHISEIHAGTGNINQSQSYTF